MANQAVIYAAKSTADEHGSIPEQIRNCRELAKGAGLEVAGEFSDEAKSGYHGDRGDQLTAAMALCQKLAPCWLLIQHSSRLARGDGKEARHLAEVALWALKHDITIESVEQRGQFNGDSALLMAAVNGQQDHAYSKRLSTSVRKGMRRGFERGDFYGRSPDGFTRAGPRLIRDTEREHTIEELFRLALEQRLQSAASIAQALNRAGLLQAQRPMNKGSKIARPWRARDVKRILTNPIYAGILTHEGEQREAADDFPRYINKEQLEDLRHRYRQESRAGRPASVPYLLTGLARCAACGSPMHVHTRSRVRQDGSRQRQYVCSGADTAGLCKVRVDADKADAEVKFMLDDLLDHLGDWRSELLSSTGQQRTEAERVVANARKALERAQKRIAAADADYELALDRDDEERAQMAVRASERASRTVRELEASLTKAEAEMNALSQEVITAEVDALARKLSSSDVALVNDALRREYQAFWLPLGTAEVRPGSRIMKIAQLRQSQVALLE